MNAEELRSIQAPLKERYRENPDAALITLHAEGDLDARGTLGISKEVPVGFQRIRLQFILETDAPQEQLDTLFSLTEKYCVIFQTLAHPPSLVISRQVVSK